MYKKWERLYEAEVLSNGSSDMWELPKIGALSAIKLDFRMENAADIQTEAKRRIIDHITEIAISDGSTRYMQKLTGQELKALHFYQTGNILPETANLRGGYSQLTTVIIPFGRFLGDEEFWLDLAAWDTLYLEISNDLTTTQTAENGCNVDIQLLSLIDLKSTAPEYMKYFQWRAQKPATDGQYIYQELPTTDILFLIMAQLDPDLDDNFKPTNDPISDSYNMQLTFKERSEVVWNHRPKDIARANAALYGMPHTSGRYVPSTETYIDLEIAYVHDFVDSAIGTTPEGIGNALWEDSNDRFMKAAKVDVGVLWNHIDAEGIGYLHTLMLYHAHDIPRADWLNPDRMPSAKGPVRLDWYGYKDDHFLRTVLGIPKAQGEA